MAKQVWECGHCSLTDIMKSKVEIHESSCTHNVSNRRCQTCEFYDFDQFGEQVCAMKRSWEFMEEDNTPCKDWRQCRHI